MSVFEQGIIAILGLGVATAVTAVVAVPLDRTAHAPQASLAFADTQMLASSAPLSTPGVSPAKPSVAVSRLISQFERLDYDLEQLRHGRAEVPPVFIVFLPADMSSIRLPSQRKQIFFKAVLPLVLKINNEIYRDRKRLKLIHDRRATGQKLPAQDRLWLAAQAEHYSVDRSNIKSLTMRMDVVPPSLALAQAAEESGWGTSRFALEGNAIFGQWTFTNSGNLIPRRREVGSEHRVRRFRSLIEAVAAYVHNLNTHRAYREFRAARAQMRRQKHRLDGAELALTLSRYSKRGSKYVSSIRSIINVNRLRDFDRVRLGSKVNSGTGKPAI